MPRTMSARTQASGETPSAVTPRPLRELVAEALVVHLIEAVIDDGLKAPVKLALTTAAGIAQRVFQIFGTDGRQARTPASRQAQQKARASGIGQDLGLAHRFDDGVRQVQPGAPRSPARYGRSHDSAERKRSAMLVSRKRLELRRATASKHRDHVLEEQRLVVIEDLGAIEALQVTQEQRRRRIGGKRPGRRARVVEDQRRQPADGSSMCSGADVALDELQQIAAHRQRLFAESDGQAARLTRQTGLLLIGATAAARRARSAPGPPASAR